MVEECLNITKDVKMLTRLCTTSFHDMDQSKGFEKNK